MYFTKIPACPEGRAFAGEVNPATVHPIPSALNGASFDSWQVTTVTVLVGPSTLFGIALIDEDEEKIGCSLSYAKGRKMNRGFFLRSRRSTLYQIECSGRRAL